MSRLTFPQLQSIRRLMRAGVRHDEIARRMNLATGTISRIASDRRLRRRRLELLDEQELPDDDPPPEYVAANLRRCLGCGGLIYHWPCLTCRLRGVGRGSPDPAQELTEGLPPREETFGPDVRRGLETCAEQDAVCATNGRGYAA